MTSVAMQGLQLEHLWKHEGGLEPTISLPFRAPTAGMAEIRINEVNSKASVIINSLWWVGDEEAMIDQIQAVCFFYFGDDAVEREEEDQKLNW